MEANELKVAPDGSMVQDREVNAGDIAVPAPEPISEQAGVTEERAVEAAPEPREGTSKVRAQRSSDITHLKEAQEQGKLVEGYVETRNKGGYEVRVGNLKAFCPFSLMDDHYYDDKDKFLAQNLSFRVAEVNEKKQRVLLSRRDAMREGKQGRLRDLEILFQEGHPLLGKVTKLEDFGAFIDLGGGVEGLLHVSEISHSRVEKPSEVLRPGDEFEVKIINIKTDEKGTRISLSRKVLEQDLWAGRLPFEEGQVVTGKVVKDEKYGAFVELLPGLDGLIHISELSDKRVNRVEDVVTVGQEVEAKIIKIDHDRKRISLSIREMLQDKNLGAEHGSFAPKAIKIGERYLAIVDNVKQNGVFVKLPEVGRDAYGFVPYEELNIERGKDLHKECPKGTTLNVELVSRDERGRNRLSVKSMHEREAQNEYQQYLQKLNQGGGTVTLGDLFPKKS